MARIHVIMMPSPARMTSSSWSALKRKRKTLWHHQERNLLVARVGRACLEQDRQALKQMGIPARKRKHGVATQRVVILVESTEHAHALSDLLPGWDMLTSDHTLEPGNEADPEEGIPLTQGNIMTWMHAERHGMQANYLIRATGWRGRMGLCGGNGLAKKERRLVVVDFLDAWDIQASMDTESRVLEYKDQGMKVIHGKESFAKA